MILFITLIVASYIGLYLMPMTEISRGLLSLDAGRPERVRIIQKFSVLDYWNGVSNSIEDKININTWQALITIFRRTSGLSCMA